MIAPSPPPRVKPRKTTPSQYTTRRLKKLCRSRAILVNARFDLEARAASLRQHRVDLCEQVESLQAALALVDHEQEFLRHEIHLVTTSIDEKNQQIDELHRVCRGGGTST